MRSGPSSASEDGRRFFRLLSDRPIENDRADHLGYGVTADALADLIDHGETETPLTVAITGPWGSGKTSLARLVEQRLTVLHHDWPEPHLICRFNAWLHDDAPSPGVALASAVTRLVNRHRPLWRRMFQPVAVSMVSPRQRWRQQVWTGVAAAVGALVVMLWTQARDVADVVAGGKGALKDLGEITRPGFVVTTAIVAVLFWIVASKLFIATTAVSRFLSSPQEEASKGSMEAVHSELGRLVAQALGGRRRLIIVVDDLDRCSGERALEICQVAAKLLSHPQVVTVLIGELDALGSAAAAQFVPETEPADTPQDLQQGREYLRKLIQVSLDLPALDAPEIQAMVRAGNPSRITPAPLLAHRARNWIRRLPACLKQALDDVDRERFKRAALVAPLVGVAVLFLLPITSAVVTQPDQPHSTTTPGRHDAPPGPPGPAAFWGRSQSSATPSDPAVRTERRVTAVTLQVATSSTTGEDITGDDFSSELKGFVASIGALLIGLIGVRFLFGEQKSLAGFLGFMMLAGAVYFFIMYGQEILGWLGGMIKAWLNPNDTDGRPLDVEFFRVIDFLWAAMGSFLTLAAGVRVSPGYGARRRGVDLDEAIRQTALPGTPLDEVAAQVHSRVPTQLSLEEMKTRVRTYLLQHPMMERASQALLPLLPNNPRAAKRTMTQLRIAVPIAFARGVLDEDSPITPAHMAKWVAFTERWPLAAESLRRAPEQLEQWECSELAFITDLRDRIAPGQSATELHEFLHASPPLAPFLWQLQHLNREISTTPTGTHT
ncbi:P-loop NTPase fold protein [Streptomyces sp. NP-1717]|uniref:KAP family P-loop NTPase fold protein n=1 Tax=Streptomyces sp. NP-1717 TaxID=2704470 RepID=UPI001F5DD210|nr:P-loop NTPase fold protein [Streptomyces sp. NP-1717]MCI3226033.1 hypothetical protein [Streptomyces sp. NP-1717]